MPRPPDLPAKFENKGALIRWWRIYRKRGAHEFADELGMKYSTLMDFENGRTHTTRDLPSIIAKLGLNAYYVKSLGKGEPEAVHPQEPPPQDKPWPLPGVNEKRLAGLNLVERKLIAYELNELLDTIERERGNRRKSG